MKEKRIIFRDCETRHASLLSKLKTIKVTQNNFFQFVLEMFITDDPCLGEFEEKLLSSKSTLGSSPRNTRSALTKQGQENAESLLLSGEEKDEIFDLLELDLEGET